MLIIVLNWLNTCDQLNDRNSYNGFSFRLFLTFVAMQIALGFPSPVAEVEACALSNSRLHSTKILNIKHRTHLTSNAKI